MGGGVPPTNSIDPRNFLSVTPKRGLDKRGLGNQSFLQKSLKNMEKQQKIVEKSYNIYAKEQQAPPSAAPQGGGASRRPLGLLFLHICCMIFQLFFVVFHVFQ